MRYTANPSGVDADFAGRYGRDPDIASTSVKSRTGYILERSSGCDRCQFMYRLKAL